MKLSRNKLCETNKDIEIFKNVSTKKRNKRIKHDTVRLELRKEMLNRVDPLRKSLMFIKSSKNLMFLIVFLNLKNLRMKSGNIKMKVMNTLKKLMKRRIKLKNT